MKYCYTYKYLKANVKGDGMHHHEFAQLLAKLEGLTDRQRKQLRERLRGHAEGAVVSALLDTRAGGELRCPGCAGMAIKRFGRVDGLQRYRCKACGRTFNALTGTPLARLRYKGRWLAFMGCLIDGLSVRAAARACGVARTTSFRWRHRFLAQPTRVYNTLSGIVEADETYVLSSRKGARRLARPARKRGGKGPTPGTGEEHVCVLTARDRAGVTFDAVLAHFDHHALDQTLAPHLADDSVLCSDGHGAYLRFARTHHRAHKALNISRGIRVRERVFHIQNVNAYHSRFHQWRRRFQGVATHYLAHYAAWFRLLDTTKPSLTPQHLFASCAGAA